MGILPDTGEELIVPVSDLAVRFIVADSEKLPAPFSEPVCPDQQQSV